MKRSMMFRITGGMSVVAGLIFAFGQGCGKLSTTDLAGSSSSSSSASTGTPAGDGSIPNSPNTQTVSLVYGKQILDHYASCLGSGVPTDRTLAMYEAKKGTISVDGAAGSLTAPMLIASTSIAGEICQDLLVQEAVAPRIFVGVSMSAASLPAQNLLKDAMRRIARSCWSRDEDPTESDIIISGVNSAFSSGATANMSHDAALFMCTSMLSSLDSLVL